MYSCVYKCKLIIAFIINNYFIHSNVRSVGNHFSLAVANCVNALESSFVDFRTSMPMLFFIFYFFYYYNVIIKLNIALFFYFLVWICVCVCVCVCDSFLMFLWKMYT